MPAIDISMVLLKFHLFHTSSAPQSWRFFIGERASWPKMPMTLAVILLQPIANGWVGLTQIGYCGQYCICFIYVCFIYACRSGRVTAWLTCWFNLFCEAGTKWRDPVILHCFHRGFVGIVCPVTCAGGLILFSVYLHFGIRCFLHWRAPAWARVGEPQGNRKQVGVAREYTHSG